MSTASTTRSDNDRRMFGSLREIRAACQYLQNLIAEILKSAFEINAAGRAKHVSKPLSAAVRDRMDQTITGSLNTIQLLFTADVGEFEWCADYIVKIRLIWSQIKDLWPAEDSTFEELEQRLKQTDGKLDEIVYCCASLSLSPRVNDVMANLRTGQALDLQFEFDDEFPKNPELRKHLIMELAQESGVIECGIIDVDEGVIYKAAASRREQRSSAWHLLGWLILGLLIPVLLALGGPVLQGWPLRRSDLERLLVAYILILVGSGSHLAVEALKADKAKTRPSFQPLNDWVLWLHVRESQIRNGIVYLWIGYVLLAFGMPTFDWSSAFFAGYSIDSMTELILKRFETVVKVETNALTARLN
jgi:hypothetical protein